MMKRDYDTILFDLDGTLTDPKEGITNAVAYALEKSLVKPPERDELICFIGPPLTDSFSEYYGFNEEKAKRATGYFREYFASRGIFENKLYENTISLLSRLKEAGYNIALATSKPTEFAVRILKHFDIADYFDFVAGSNFDGTRTEKAEVIEHVLASVGAPLKKTVMIGDRKHDILGAKKNGISSIGVLYGYGSREEFENAGADFIICDMKELMDFFNV